MYIYEHPFCAPRPIAQYIPTADRNGIYEEQPDHSIFVLVTYQRIFTSGLQELITATSFPRLLIRLTST